MAKQAIGDAFTLADLERAKALAKANKVPMPDEIEVFIPRPLAERMVAEGFRLDPNYRIRYGR